MKIILNMLAGPPVIVGLKSITPFEFSQKVIDNDSEWVKVRDDGKIVAIINRNHIASMEFKQD